MMLQDVFHEAMLTIGEVKKDLQTEFWSLNDLNHNIKANNSEVKNMPVGFLLLFVPLSFDSFIFYDKSTRKEANLRAIFF